MRFELTTLTLARLCSTPELRPRRLDRRSSIKARGGPQGGKRAFREFFATGFLWAVTTARLALLRGRAEGERDG